jgi:tricorn protease
MFLRQSGFLLLLITLAAAVTSPGEDEGLPYLSRPAISPDGGTIAFVYAGDIYLVPSQGGRAALFVSHSASDSNPRFSPDGKRLAFTSERTGGGDVYVISLESGDLKRLTWHSGNDQAESWSADGRWIYFSSSRHDVGGSTDIYKVAVEGGTPVPVSRDRYEEEYNAAVSPDGKTLAFNSNDGVRQWWRKGPVVNDATEVWLKSNDPSAVDYRQFTAYKGMDSRPMWAPDGSGLYFISDEGPEGQENIWFQSISGERRRLTSFTDGRVLWPDIARRSGDIVFERGFSVWLLKAGGEAAQVPITVVADERSNPIENKTYTSEVEEYAVSPDNKKVAFVVHGEVFAAPAEKGEDEPTPGAFRVTRTAAREKGIAWSADSNKLFYTSDRHGNPDLFVYDFIVAEEKRLTQTEEPEYSPVVSPDGKWCAYYSGMKEIRLIKVDDLSDHPFTDGFFPDEQLYGSPMFCWSPDSAWIAYFSVDERFFTNLHAKRIEGEGGRIQLTYLPNINGVLPHWSCDGRFIVFTTSQYRSENQIMRIDLLPIEPEFQEDKFEELFEKPKAAAQEEKDKESDKKEGEKQKEVKVVIVPEGIKDRLRRLASFHENSSALGLTPDGKQLLFANRSSGNSILWSVDADPSENKPAKLLLEDRNYPQSLQFSKDGKTLWLLQGGSIKSMPAKGGSVKPYSLRAEMEVDFHAEKLQSFREAWYMLRDHFYDGTFNGLDWTKEYEAYLPYAAGARNTDDLSTIINLMLGDLNASHMGCRYFSGGAEPTGDLGITIDPAEYQERGRFRVEDVVPGGPVALESSDLAAGAYLSAVDGVPLTKETNLYELLDRKVGKRVILTYSPEPEGKERKELSVKAVSQGNLSALRYRRWVRGNEAYVEKISGGRLGYVHIPNMGGGALEQFKLDLDSQVHGKEGVVVDVRYNTGGFVAPFVLDVLQRRTTMVQSFRGRSRSSSENYAGSRILDRPTVLLQNEQSLSNAEMFAEGYRKLGLGKIVGTESNGWVIWTRGSRLLNGCYLRLPRVAVLTLDGEDLDEAARKPDVFVDRPLGQSLTGADQQLDLAVKVLLEQLDSSQ